MSAYVAYPPNTDGFFLTMMILTTLFSIGSGVHLGYYFTGQIGPSYEIDEHRDVRHMSSVYPFLIFLIDLVCHCAPVYLYIESGSGTMGEEQYRTAKIVYALAIFTAAGFINFCYKIYFLAKIEKFKSLKEENFDTGLMKRGHQVMFTLHAMFFWAIVIGCMCAVMLPGGWRSDIPSNCIMVAGILILLISLLSFTNRTAEVHIQGIQKVWDSQNDKNFDYDETVLSVTPTTHIITTRALKLDPFTELLKDIPEKEEIVMLGDIPINKNSMEGRALIKTSDHFKTHHVSIRRIGGVNYGMKAEDAVIVDNDVNNSLGGSAFKVGTIVPTSQRVLHRISPYLQDIDGVTRPVTDRLLDPLELNFANRQKKTGYVALVKNFDLLKHGFFAFTEDVWSVSYGLGIHINFTKDFIYPYILFMNYMHVYFLYDTLYGNIAWAVTTFVPFIIAKRGTFSQFWDMHVKCFIVGWGLIALTKPVMEGYNPSIDTFIYDVDVWNNTDYSPGLCPSGCVDLNDSVYLYVMGVVVLVMSIYYFFYGIMIAWVSWNMNTKVHSVAARLSSKPHYT